MLSTARSVASRIIRPSLADSRISIPATVRWLSSSLESGGPDSHDDFKPLHRAPEEAISVHESIEKDIKENPVMVYMKGVPDAPQCGFSAMVVRILNHYEVPFQARNVLADQELRQGIKTYSQWPTVPQVYVNGEFVGGCDILVDMHKTGQLQNKLDEAKPKVAA